MPMGASVTDEPYVPCATLFQQLRQTTHVTPMTLGRWSSAGHYSRRMPTLPARGPAVRMLGLPLPPAAAPMFRRWRPLKRWGYVGVYTPDLILCIGDAHIGPVSQRFRAVALPGGELHERTTSGPGGVAVGPGHAHVRTGSADIELGWDEGEAVEIACPAQHDGWAWTAKQVCVPVSGWVVLDGHEHQIDGPFGFIDDTAGYHDRHTAWKWSAGVGRTTDGRDIGWNLVDGVHDGDPSERTLWVEGEPTEPGANSFAPDLSGVAFAEGGALTFTEWSVREETVNRLIARSRYRQPFGTFTRQLPGGLELAAGYGVMEEHDVHW